MAWTGDGLETTAIGTRAAQDRLPVRLCALCYRSAVVSVGALAVGALAIGTLAIRRLVLNDARIGRLRVDELEVGRVRFRELIVDDQHSA